MTAYYNEIDPFAVQWLRNLITAGLIAPGMVDDRSIEDVQPADLMGFTQCHFFAGIGVWSHALRAAGWNDDRPAWTGSCPCQPFSAAGKGEGFADERHLWPAWFHLIGECRPSTIFGEQVGSRDGITWLDLVQDDLESLAYSCGPIIAPAAAFGAPHQRHRLYFVADAKHAERWPVDGHRENERDGEDAGREEAHGFPGACREVCNMAHSISPERRRGAEPQRDEQRGILHPSDGGPLGTMADNGSLRRDATIPGISGKEGTKEPDRDNPAGHRGMGDTFNAGLEGYAGNGARGVRQAREISEPDRSTGAPNVLNGFWSDAIWIPCRDGKARATKPGIFPLAHGVAGRVGRLRAYGNCIVAPQATEFIKAAMEALCAQQ